MSFYDYSVRIVIKVRLNTKGLNSCGNSHLIAGL